MADAKLTALTEVGVPDLADLLYSVDVSDTTDDAAGSSRKLLLRRLIGLIPRVPQGRLTTETGVPVSSSDQLTKGTLYYTFAAITGGMPGTGLDLYDGTAWRWVEPGELSKAFSSSLTFGKNYDVFIDYNSGSPQIVLSAAWTNDTTRADALAVSSGRIVKSGTLAYRWVGVIRASATDQIEDSLAKRYVWNAYNQVLKIGRSALGGSHTYNAASDREWNNSSTEVRIGFVIGAAQQVTAWHNSLITRGSTAFHSTKTWIDGAEIFTGSGRVVLNISTASTNISASGVAAGYAALGYHYVTIAENNGGTGGGATFDNGACHFLVMG